MATQHTPSDTLDRLLHEHFGLPGFRPLQRELIQAVLGGESAFGVLPTGGGKSLCYQLPALQMAGLTLVVSPLISLMKDQVDALVGRGIDAISINSQDTPQEMQQKLADIRAGRVRIVYVAPERLKSGAFLEVCRSVQVSLLAVDEAHCVSQWGHDFRPDYRFIRDFRTAVGDPPLLALTATATRRVQEDVVTHLGIEAARRYLAGVDRPNLWLGVERCETVAEKRGKVISLASRTRGSTIVYVSSRREADELAELLEDVLGEPVAAYHAGMSPTDRTSVQNRFMAGLVRVVTATNAFGMGIDKADIRAVIHAGVPESIEAYFQEVGRAGRDGEPAECTLVVVPGMDVKMRQYLLEKDEPTRESVDALLRSVQAVAKKGEGIVALNERDAAMGTLILSYLQGMELLELVQRTQTGMRVRATQPIPGDLSGRIWKQVQQHLAAKMQRFHQLRRFVYLDSCRRAFLLNYFGEGTAEAQDACCSACHPRPVVAQPVPKRGKRRTARKEKAPVQEVDNPELFERLKAWRRTTAEARGVPAYVIFGDRDLASIAARSPRNLDELAACRGVGPSKLEMYGEDVLAIVREAPPAPGRNVPTGAAPLLERGATLTEVAEALGCTEDAAWTALLAWVVESRGTSWKAQVRRHLSGEEYVAIRTALRAGSDGLGERFGERKVALARAVMKRVGQ